MSIRHETCASVWACAGQRYFVPRTYPDPPNPLSPPISGPRREEPAVLAAAGVERRGPLTALPAERLKARRCIAVGPNRRAAPRGPPPNLNGVSPRDTPPYQHRSTTSSPPRDLDLLARASLSAMGITSPIHAASALF
jgi:hypothetical protein